MPGHPSPPEGHSAIIDKGRAILNIRLPVRGANPRFVRTGPMTEAELKALAEFILRVRSELRGRDPFAGANP